MLYPLNTPHDRPLAFPRQSQKGAWRLWPYPLSSTHTNLQVKRETFLANLQGTPLSQQVARTAARTKTNMVRINSSTSTSSDGNGDTATLSTVTSSPSWSSCGPPSPSSSYSSRASPASAASSFRDPSAVSAGINSPQQRVRAREHRAASVSVSPGAGFVPYRSPALPANPRGTSLRGTGAVVGRKVSRWCGRR